MFSLKHNPSTTLHLNLTWASTLVLLSSNCTGKPIFFFFFVKDFWSTFLCPPSLLSTVFLSFLFLIFALDIIDVSIIFCIFWSIFEKYWSGADSWAEVNKVIRRTIIGFLLSEESISTELCQPVQLQILLSQSALTGAPAPAAYLPATTHQPRLEFFLAVHLNRWFLYLWCPQS